MNKSTTTIVIVIAIIAACGCLLCLGGGGAYIATNPGAVQIDQLDSYQFTSTPFVVLDLQEPVAQPTAIIPPTGTTMPTATLAPASIKSPTATPIVLNIEEAQAKTDVTLADFMPFFAEISRQQWDKEITDAQADEKRDKLESIFVGKRLLDTVGTITDASWRGYSNECRLDLVAEYVYTMGHSWVDLSFKELEIWVTIPNSNEDHCLSFNIGQRVTVSGNIESTIGRLTEISNATVK